ncbi:hypothetical protein EBZ80_04680 [bacterium]|nr:hypothetical protein [bacterium]
MKADSTENEADTVLSSPRNTASRVIETNGTVRMKLRDPEEPPDDDDDDDDDVAPAGDDFPGAANTSDVPARANTNMDAITTGLEIFMRTPPGDRLALLLL